MKLIHRVVAAALAVCTVPVAVSAARPTLEAFRQIRGVGSVGISPDGSTVAYVVSTGDYAHDRWNRTLVLAPATGGAARTVFAAHVISDPQFAAGGRTVLFLSDDAKDRTQVFAVSVAGGRAHQITKSESDVEQFSISPDGRRVAFVREDVPNARAKEAHDDLWEVHDDGFLTENKPQPSHIWLTGIGGGVERRLTSGTWSVLEAAPPFAGNSSDPSWSPDGKQIAFTMQANADNSDSDKTRIAVVNVADGRVTMADTEHRDYEYEPSFAPRGTGAGIAFIYPHGPGPISVFDTFIARDGSASDASTGADLDVQQVAWLPGGALALVAPSGARSRLYVLKNGQVSAVDTGEVEVESIAVAENGAIAFVGSSTAHPNEIYIVDSARARTRALSHVNDAFASSVAFGKSEEFRWTSRDGKQCDAVLTYPPGFVAGKKYPLVLRIHGGPEASSSMTFSSIRQLLAARGYVVMEPNYRGSDNLGTDYEHAIYRDAGTGPGNDVMDGIAALESRGFIDTAHEAVTGHSYGGYMTTWLIGHDSRWRSAVVGDGMVDWIEEYNLSGTGNLAWARDSFGGSPWDPALAAMYREQSPISYVSTIKTPARIISGTADDQVPVSESYALYHALADRGVPVSFVAIPGAQHNAHDPTHIEGYIRVTLEWVDRYMR